MYARLPKYVGLFLVSALAFTGCSDSTDSSPTGPSGLQTAIFTADPSIVVPQFFPTPFCPQFSPFGAHFTIVIRPSHDLFVHGMQFHFVDRFGVRSIPAVFPVQTTPAAVTSNPGPVTIPTSPTIPFPGASTPFPASSPIPIPGVSGFDPLLILAGTSRALPIFLQFGCGIPASGVVFVDFDVSDRRGRRSTSQLRVQVRD